MKEVAHSQMGMNNSLEETEVSCPIVQLCNTTLNPVDLQYVYFKINRAPYSLSVNCT